MGFNENNKNKKNLMYVSLTRGKKKIITDFNLDTGIILNI
jgi:hypothetical protein